METYNLTTCNESSASERSEDNASDSEDNTSDSEDNAAEFFLWIIL